MVVNVVPGVQMSSDSVDPLLEDAGADLVGVALEVLHDQIGRHGELPDISGLHGAGGLDLVNAPEVVAAAELDQAGQRQTRARLIALELGGAVVGGRHGGPVRAEIDVM